MEVKERRWKVCRLLQTGTSEHPWLSVVKDFDGYSRKVYKSLHSQKRMISGFIFSAFIVMWSDCHGQND